MLAQGLKSLKYVMVLLASVLRVFGVLVISELSRRARAAATAERRRVWAEERVRAARLFDLLHPGVERPRFEEDIPIDADYRRRRSA